jgi:hypothetical protein
MSLTGPKPSEKLKRGLWWCATKAGFDADRGADATTVRYQIANPRGHISLRVFLRLTAMDVCCGPPAPVPVFLIA